MENFGSVVNVIIVILLLALIIGLILFFVLKYLENKNVYSEFKKYAEERGLTQKEINLLWKFSKKLNRDPLLSLEFKSPFEKIINAYINSTSNYNEEMIRDIRRKLGFEVASSLQPISITKDIEIFQSGELKTKAKNRYEVALYDKDEKYMYWMIFNLNKIPFDIKKGQKVKVSFIRKDDANYLFESKVLDAYLEKGKVIVKIPHTFDIHRLQRREVPRLKIEIPAEARNKESLSVWIKGELIDLSTKGAKFCIDSKYKDEINLLIDDKVEIRFVLENKEFDIEGKVSNISEYRRNICYGIRITSIPKKDEEFILRLMETGQKEKIAE
jgi:hypothetical protein